MSSVFASIKSAVQAGGENTIAELGIQLKSNVRGEWWQCLCPLCDDKNGSASITPKGFLRCHQCDSKLDLFEWYGQLHNKSPWEVCQELAEKFHINILPFNAKNRIGKMPAAMTPKVLRESIENLWGLPEAGPARDFLQERKISRDPSLLAEMGVGWIGGTITFAQWDAKGILQERYRSYQPGAATKWRWMGKGTGGPGLWLAHWPVESKVLLLEGEWDVITALVRCRLHEQGWAVSTWTSGASSSPIVKDIPAEWHGKEVHICYDNDVFQGPDYTSYYGKSPNANNSVKALLKNLLTRIAPTFDQINCPVFIRQIPIPPQEIWGADFRDWVNKVGEKNFLIEQLPVFEWSKLPPFSSPDQVLQFDELWDHPGDRARAKMVVNSIYGDDLLIPTSVQIKCQMGQLNICNSCKVPVITEDGMLDLSPYVEQVAIGIEEENLSNRILKNICKQPKGCPEATVKTITGSPGSKWTASRTSDSDDTRQRIITVISAQPPSLSGECDVFGTLYSMDERVILYADRVAQLDRAEIDVSSIYTESRALCPFWATSVSEIDDYLDKRWRDLSRHITKVYGRRDVHVACELLFHSATEIPVGGKNRRGWLDIALIGDTRTGKSMTIRGLIEWLRLGSLHSAVNNVSRAGLVMGADKKNYLKPGLMTRSHRKLLCLDEFHWLVGDHKMGQDHPMSWLQSARDEGKVYGVKIYGDKSLPAKVRFATISNWAQSNKRKFQYPCQHLNWLYGSPETLSRMDYGIVVDSEPSQKDFDEVEHKWTQHLVRGLILRAWAQDAAQIHIEPKAEEAAFEVCESWRDLYSTKLPLYTPEEKPYSLLRIATAIANMCFSHLEGNIYSTLVKLVHVEWAAEWLKHTYSMSQYDVYSQMQKTKDEADSPFTHERFLLVRCKINEPSEAIRVLGALQEGVPSAELSNILGIPDMDRVLFLSAGIRAGVWRMGSRLDESRTTIYLTEEAYDIATKLAHQAMSEPEAFMERINRLRSWTHDNGNAQGTLTPIKYY